MNNEAKEIIENLVRLMGFEDFSVTFVEESKRFLIFINDAPFLKKFLPQFISDFEFLVKMILGRKNLQITYVDVNNYRKEREELIIKLAKAAAKKASITKEEVALPPMNAYERRIVHSQLSLHPDLKTESVGEGKERHVVIKPIENS
jgi:spoIIIJ-associated protein